MIRLNIEYSSVTYVLTSVDESKVKKMKKTMTTDKVIMQTQI